MKVKAANMEAANKVVSALYNALKQSRFKLLHPIDIEKHKRHCIIIMRGIRLKTSKPYCGNHAGPCLVDFRPHHKYNYLEGLDWVSFNDMVNDTLDSIHHSGTAGTSVCVIRKDSRRRTAYYAQNNGEWIKTAEDMDYVDYCGKRPPKTVFVKGTPGILGWKE